MGMPVKQFVDKLINIANNYKTLYVMGCFGAPMIDRNKERYSNNNSYNRDETRSKMIKEASSDTFGFDCVCLIKSVLWGWSGNVNHVYGGATYQSNSVPDIGTESMINVCSNVSSDFSKIEVGELVWLKGHVGVYIGNNLVVESTPAWKNGVQITTIDKTNTKYNCRLWAKHGLLPYVDYTEQKKTPDVIYQVLSGKQWLPEVKNYNTTNSDGYAGMIGTPITQIRVKLSDKDTVKINCHVCGLPETSWPKPLTSWSRLPVNYKGLLKKHIDCVAIEANKHKLKYRVHLLGGGWLDWVNKYDLKDSVNGVAGIYGKHIDAIQICCE